MSHQVQETNDYSIASKYSMVHKGYFKDDYIPLLSPKLKRRSPLINIGYYVRAVVVNEGIKQFLSMLPDIDCQIVSLGAGFDTTYFRLVFGQENVNYFEIDFKGVVDNKIRYIKNSEILINKLIDPQETQFGFTSKHYSIISQDLSHILELESILISIGFSMTKPTLFFSECAITYMAEDSSRKLINWASRLDNVVFMVYEQITPDDGFGHVMMCHFNTIDNPLKSVEVHKTKEDQIYRYKSCGFARGCSVGAFEIYKKTLSHEEHRHILSLEPFDEWEEWHLTSSHYTLSFGAKGIFEQPLSNFFSLFTMESDIQLKKDSPIVWEFLKDSELKLYAHSSLPIWNSEAIIIIGGFGLSSDSKHKRLDQLHILNLKTMKVTVLASTTTDAIKWDCMYHSCSMLSDSDNETRFLLYGGRTSPVNNVNSPGFIIVIKKGHQESVDINVKRVTLSGNYPQARRRHCSLSVRGGVFMCGGLASAKNSSLQVFGDSWLFTDDEKWVQLESKLPPRFSHSAVCHHTLVFVIGGLSQEYKTLNDIWSFNMSDNVWTQYDMNILPRYSHTLHVFDDFIIVIGGVNELSELQPGICIINLKSKTFTEYNLPKSTEAATVMLHNHSSIMSSDLNSIYIIGGGGNCFSFGTSFNKHIILLKLDALRQNR